MQKKTKRYVMMIFSFLLLSVALATVQAQQDFAIDWHTLDGGGGTSSGGDFTLTGTLGQADASGLLTGGAFSLRGGFGTISQVIPTVIELAEMSSVNEILPSLLTLISILLTITSLYLILRNKETQQ